MTAGGLPLFTPPQTPGPSAASSHNGNGFVAGVKREADPVEGSAKDKRRRIQPTLVSDSEGNASTSVTSVPPPHPSAGD